jgi:hypothetical protein
MAKLNAAARAAIRAAGFTSPQWAAMWGYRDGQWGGDACGCFDDRCIGHHHDGADGCGCVQSMLDDAVAWRAATRHPNDVELAAPIGLYRWVNVSTPGTLVTVSATAGSPGRSPEESVIRIEAREGWTATIGEDKHGRMEIRLVKAPAPEAEATHD